MLVLSRENMELLGMASVNKWIGIGNLGSDPDIRYLPSGDAVANVSIACSEKYKSKKTGEIVEETEWVRLAFFGKLAEIVGEYLKKGSPVYVEGRIKTRKWQDKEGKDRYITEVVATTIRFLGGGSGEGEGGSSRGSNSRPAGSRTCT